MKRRVFVAIKLTKDLQEEIIAYNEKFGIPVRWIAAKNLHITLVPPRYEEDIEKVKRDLHRLQKHKPFDIALNNVSFGPKKQPRLIWATGEATKEILQLQEHVESTLGAHNEQQFKLHITLARFRPEDFKRFTVHNIDEKIDWRMTVDSIVLMESHLSREGSDYEVLEEIKFH